MDNNSNFQNRQDRLELITSIAAISPTKARILHRYLLQDMARELLPDERVAWCLRRIASVFNSVEIIKDDVSKKAYYKHLMTCASIWHCPVCAAHISEERRKELTVSLAKSALKPILITYTLRHSKIMPLRPMVGALAAAFRVYKASYDFRSARDEYLWVGSIRGFETTYGMNGWHPHYHELALLKVSLNETGKTGLERTLKIAWVKALIKQGYDASVERGVHIETRDSNIREYIAKTGKDENPSGWTLEHELTKAVTKKGKMDGRTPMQLLDDYSRGDLTAGILWREYAYAFKGKNQLVWSRGLREELGLKRELTEQEIIDQTPDNARVLVTLSREQWVIIVSQRLRAEVIFRASVLNDDDFIFWLEYIVGVNTDGPVV